MESLQSHGIADAALARLLKLSPPGVAGDQPKR